MNVKINLRCVFKDGSEQQNESYLRNCLEPLFKL